MAKEKLLIDVKVNIPQMYKFPHAHFDTFDVVSALFNTDNLILDSKLANLDIGSFSVCTNQLCSLYNEKVEGPDVDYPIPIQLNTINYHNQSLIGSCIQELFNYTFFEEVKRHGPCAQCGCTCVKRKEFKAQKERPILVPIILGRDVFGNCCTMGKLDRKVILFGEEYVLVSVVYCDTGNHFNVLIATKVGGVQGIFKCDGTDRGGEFVPISSGYFEHDMFPDHIGKGDKSNYYFTKEKKRPKNPPKLVKGFVAHTLYYVRSDMLRFSI